MREVVNMLTDKRGLKVKTVPVTPNMDQTTSRPMPVATTLPAARDVQAMQQRRRLEGGRWQFNRKFLDFLLWHAIPFRYYCQGNIFS